MKRHPQATARPTSFRMAKSIRGPDLVLHLFFCKYCFLVPRSCSFLYVLSVAALTLQHQSWVAVTETIWPAKPKYVLSGPFIEKGCQCLVQKMPRLYLRPTEIRISGSKFQAWVLFGLMLKIPGWFPCAVKDANHWSSLRSNSEKQLNKS